MSVPQSQVIIFQEGQKYEKWDKVHLFHEMTLTSEACASTEIAGDFPIRVSQIAIFLSTEEEAKTSDSVGLHYKGKKRLDHANIRKLWS